MFELIKRTIGTIRNLIIVLAVFIIIINTFLHFIAGDKKATNTHATEDVLKKQLYARVLDPKLNSTKEGKLSSLVARVFTCKTIGEICSTNLASRENNFKDSLLGGMSNLTMIPLTNPPASGVQWVAQQFSNAGIFPKAFAAEGIGFAALTPYQNIWKVFRDLSFMILVLIMVAIGFMIMFRVKVNPQTVISIENALPRIVIAMILITFSYAIVGLMIDLMYLTIALIIALLSDGTHIGNALELQNKYLGGGIDVIWDSLWPKNPGIVDNFYGGLWNDFFPQLKGILALPEGLFQLFGIGQNLLDILPDVLQGFVRLLGFILTILATDKIVNLVSQGGSHILDDIMAVTFGVGQAPSSLIGFVVMIISFIVLSLILVPLLIGILVFFTIVLALFRIFWLLLMSYIRLLLLILFAPVILMLEAFPGRNTFGFWFKGVLGELIAFPTVITLFLVSNIIVNNINPANNQPNLWMPPLLYGVNQYAFIFLVGLGILFLIPDLVKALKGMLGSKGLPLNFGLGTFFAGAGVGVGQTAGLAMKTNMFLTTLRGPNGGLGKVFGGVLGDRFKGFFNP